MQGREGGKGEGGERATPRHWCAPPMLTLLQTNRINASSVCLCFPLEYASRLPALQSLATIATKHTHRFVSKTKKNKKTKRSRRQPAFNNDVVWLVCLFLRTYFYLLCSVLLNLSASGSFYSCHRDFVSHFFLFKQKLKLKSSQLTLSLFLNTPVLLSE